MEILVVGAGYVGLVQAGGLASTGNDVTLVDISKERINLLNQGQCPIYEPGLPDLLETAQKQKRLVCFMMNSDAFKEKLKAAEIIFLAVGTPEGPNGSPSLEHLFSAAESVATSGVSLKNKILVIKSTVPVGTADALEAFLEKKDVQTTIVSNPEFLKQGSAVTDFLKPERVIIGTSDARAKEILHDLYKPFMLKRERCVFMTRRSAELVKYACNSFLATKISFINEISQLAERVGADIREIREGMITDSRIGEQFLFPGIGYGGSCLPKDTHALIAQGKTTDLRMGLIEAVDRVNEQQKSWAFQKLQTIFSGDLRGKVIALWGVSFKPNTDDLREAPSLPFISRVLESGAMIQVNDPAAMSRLKQQFSKDVMSGRLALFDDPYAAAAGANALAVFTEWTTYRTPHFGRLKELLKEPNLLDARVIYSPEALRKMGFHYHGVGIP